jgi:phage/plasmid-associated DNA primase
MDTLTAFVDECLKVEQGKQVSTGAVHTAYSEWAKRNGEVGIRKRQLTERMKEKGFVINPGAKNKRFFQDVSFSDDVEITETG